VLRLVRARSLGGDHPVEGLAQARRGVGEHAGEARRRGAWQSDAHAWLNDAIALQSNSFFGVDLHTIQRVRNGFDHTPRGAGRQLRIRIERDHVANLQGQPAGDQQLVRSAAAQEPVQVFDLAALPFAADPQVFALGPDAVPVEQQKPVSGIPHVEGGDAVFSSLEQFCVVRHGGLLGIPEVGQQSEKQIRLPIGQEAHFQFFDLLRHHSRESLCI